MDDGVARRVGFSFRTDVLVDEDIANEGAWKCVGMGGRRVGYPWIVVVCVGRTTC